MGGLVFGGQVKSWRILWEWLNNYSSVSSNVIRHRPCTMNCDLIPKERDGSPNLAIHMFDKLHH
jgi:hypothetical protein